MNRRWLITLGLILASCGNTGPSASTATSVTLPSTIPPTTSPVETAPPTTSPETTTPVTTSPVGETACPEVEAVDFSETAPNVFTVSATVRSVDVEGVSFADAWEVRGPDGTVLGIRILAHPHANEQPFTRSLNDVAIPSALSEVEVVARDSVRGFCGAGLIVAVPRS